MAPFDQVLIFNNIKHKTFIDNACYMLPKGFEKVPYKFPVKLVLTM